MDVFSQEFQPLMEAPLVQPPGFPIQELLHLADKLFIHAYSPLFPVRTQPSVL
jgi:hypothetical protein